MEGSDFACGDIGAGKIVHRGAQQPVIALQHLDGAADQRQAIDPCTHESDFRFDVGEFSFQRRKSRTHFPLNVFQCQLGHLRLRSPDS